MRPPFDPQEFAREADSKVRIAEGVPRLSLPPTVPPPPDLPAYPIDVPAIPRSIPAERADAIPELAVTRSDFEWFDLSPLAHRLLLLVNGRDSVATICARSGVDLADAFEVLDELTREGLVSSSASTRE